MIKDLALIANRLDSLGLTKEADYLDRLIQKVAMEPVSVSEDTFLDLDLAIRAKFKSFLDLYGSSIEHKMLISICKDMTDSTVSKIGSLARDHLVITNEKKRQEIEGSLEEETLTEEDLESIKSEVPSEPLDQKIYEVMLAHGQALMDSYKVDAFKAMEEIYSIAMDYVKDVENYISDIKSYGKR